MTSSIAEKGARAVDVSVDSNELTVLLADGRRVHAPLARFPRLAAATTSQRSNWQLLGEGEAIRWPQIDEDLSVRGLLGGTPSSGPPLARTSS
jgi:hypothetical protein